MLHVSHKLINSRGEVVAQWEFCPVSISATVQFIMAVVSNRNATDVRYVIDIALPAKKED